MSLPGGGGSTGPLVIALDQGSSSSRALAVDLKGRVAARAQFPVKTYRPRPGWIEHDAEQLARSQEQALDAVLRRLPRKAAIAGVGVAAQRSTVVFWDKKTGKAVCRAPSWQDGRAAAIVAPLQARQAWAHERTGLYLTPYYSAPKILWTLENVPAARALADQGRLLMGPVSTFILWRLTRGEVFAADPTTAQRTMLFDLRAGDWDRDLIALFGVPREALPALAPSAGELGAFKRQGRTLRLLAALGDQQAAAVGLGALGEGSSVLNYGTGAFFLYNTGTTQHRVPGLLASAGPTVGEERAVFYQEGTVHAAGSSFDWLRDNLRLIKDARELDRHWKASKERVWALPAIGGLGAPRWDYATKTAFYGLTSSTRPSDLVRGVAEGLAFLVSDIVAALRDKGLSPGPTTVAGGLSRSDALLQFQADILGLELRRRPEPEATAMGVAALALKAAGLAPYPRRSGGEKAFKPSLPSDDAARLRERWTRFVAAQRSLAGL